jgi:hypothetical protein
LPTEPSRQPGASSQLTPPLANPAACQAKATPVNLNQDLVPKQLSLL